MQSNPLARMMGYEDTELEPAIHAEILTETSRSQARTAILELLLAVAFGLWTQFQGELFQAIAIFAVVTVIPLLIDASLRRGAANRILAMGPQPERK